MLTCDQIATRPTAAMLRAVRGRHGYTQAQAGFIVAVSPRQWQKWESEDGAMPLGPWWLFLLRVSEVTPAMLPEIPPRQRAGAMIHVTKS